jgi:hypothetical protein
MLVPGAAPVGAVLVAGAMIYENREAIMEGAKKAKDWVGDKVSKGLKKLNPFSKG